MPRRTGPDFIGLQAEDLDAAVTFCGGRLGLPVARRRPEAVVFATTPTAFEVRKPMGPLAGAKGLGDGPWFGCDDPQAFHDRPATEGVEILSPPAPGPFGTPLPIATLSATPSSLTRPTLSPRAEGPRFWVGVASADHVAAGVEGGFCQLSHGKAGPVARMAPGDGLAYYAPRERMGEGDPVQAFVAIGSIADGEPYPGAMGDVVAMRRDVLWWPNARRAPIRPLLDALSFSRGQPNWGLVLRRGSFCVTAEDFDLIARAMGATPMGLGLGHPRRLHSGGGGLISGPRTAGERGPR